MKKSLLSILALGAMVAVGCNDKVTPTPDPTVKPTPTVTPTPTPTPTPAAGEEYSYIVDDKTAWACDWTDKTAKSGEWTIEVKFRKTGDWNTDGISNRLITIGNAGEKGIMLRFNDDGGKHVGAEDWGLLQVCSLPSVGNFYVGENTEKNPEGPYKFGAAEGGEVNLYKFHSETWYTVSFVNDGSKLYMYVNGELITTINDAAYELQLQRVDLGMVWGYASDGHDGKTGWVYRQRFNGMISYARCWYKACTEEEIKANLCQLENNAAEGLQMNLLFNEGEGTKITDKSGHGYDYDLEKAWWDCGSHEACPDAAKTAASAWAYVETTCD